MPSCAPTAGLSGSWIGYDNTSSYSSGGNNAFLGGLLTYGEFGVGACGSCTGYDTTQLRLPQAAVPCSAVFRYTTVGKARVSSLV
jgi:hypothetical protein